jgi:RNA polymerase sigma-54 factor
MVELQLFPSHHTTVDTRLIIANSILQLSTVELEQAIIKELDQNPALELIEQPSCPSCGGPLHSGYCNRCSSADFKAQESSFHSFDAPLSELDSPADDRDPLALLAAPFSLSDQLLAQLRLTLDEADQKIAFYLVGSLDEHGYLTLSVEELAQILHVETTRVMAVLKKLQQLEPAGIGARNLVECLLIQATRLAAEGKPLTVATRAIIENHLEELSHHQFEHIRHALNISREEVEEAFLFIRTNLHPYPADLYYAHAYSSPAASSPPVPSVLIQRSTTSACSYDVEVTESQHFLLRLNPLYQQIRQRPELTASPHELEHVIHFLGRARLFISQLQRRYLLLHKVATYVVDYQRDFLDRGALHLRPLTQKQVAQVLGVHVSTISRAIADKFAELPSHELIPLSRFFSSELRVQELISQVIVSETEPLSDARIAVLLGERYGISLSRQMVANYRTCLDIPAARQRAVLRRM